MVSFSFKINTGFSSPALLNKLRFRKIQKSASGITKTASFNEIGKLKNRIKTYNDFVDLILNDASFDVPDYRYTAIRDIDGVMVEEENRDEGMWRFRYWERGDRFMDVRDGDHYAEFKKESDYDTSGLITFEYRFNKDGRVDGYICAKGKMIYDAGLNVYYGFKLIKANSRGEKHRGYDYGYYNGDKVVRMTNDHDPFAQKLYYTKNYVDEASIEYLDQDKFKAEVGIHATRLLNKARKRMYANAHKPITKTDPQTYGSNANVLNGSSLMMLRNSI